MFKQTVCKIDSNNIHDIHKKPNEKNPYNKPKADSLEKLCTKITQEFLPLSGETMH